MTDVSKYIALLACIFQGFVISDWEGVNRITSPPNANYTYSVEASVMAGVDMVSMLMIVDMLIKYNF